MSVARITKDGIAKGRRLAFESLEVRRLLSVSVDLASRAATSSTSADGESGSSSVVVGGNGRYVVYDSDAHNLVAGLGSVPNGSHNLFRFDRVSGETILVSVGASGDEYGNGYCTVRGLSDDGNVVLFSSSATNLHPLDTTIDQDIYVRNIATGSTQVVNLNAEETGKVQVSIGRSALSSDGTLVVFSSESNDVHPLDHNSLSDVFVRNLATGVVELVSINTSEDASGNARSSSGNISANGRMVLFSSDASNLHPLDTNEVDQRNDLYARDLMTGETHLVTINVAGTGGIDASASYFSISADGMRVVFESSSSKLHLGDQRYDDIFVRDLSTGTTHWISDGTTYVDRPTISANGRLVAYWIGNTVKTFDFETGDSTESPYASLFNSNSPSISGDGTTIAFDIFEGNNLRIYVRNVVSGELKAIGMPDVGDFSLRSGLAQLSHDGSTVVFTGTATTLVEGDHNGKLDVFSFDVSTGDVQLISQKGQPESSSTAAGWSNARRSAVSADGRYVVFTSDARNLVANMNIAPGVRNVYRYDRITGETILVSVNVDGTGGGNEDSGDDGANRENEINPSISADGNVVTFVSWARNLDVRDKNSGQDVYARDIASGTTHLVSVNLAGTAGAGGYHPLLSADGKRIVFSSSGNNLQSIQVSGQQLYVRDLHEGVTRLVSVAWNGAESADRSIDDSSGISINRDGSVIAFVSNARNLHPLQTTDATDNVFVRDMEGGVTHLASVNSAGTGGANQYSHSPVLNADGSSVAFLSRAGNLHPLRPNTSPISYTDAYVRNLITNETHLVSVDATGTRGANGNIQNLSMSADGRVVTFETSAGNISTAELDGQFDVYARDLSLGITTHVSDDFSAVGFLNADAYHSTLSADGTKVAFVSIGAILVRSLVTGETILVAPGTAYVEDDSSYSPSLNSDGTVIAFWSEAADLVDRDWNDADDVFVATLLPAEPVLPGDYNLDGRVDAADYTVWRNTLGQSGLTSFSSADGDGDGTIDEDDYGVWKSHFGETIEQGAGSGEQGVKAEDPHPLAAALLPHPLDNSRPLPEGEAVYATLAEPLAAASLSPALPGASAMEGLAAVRTVVRTRTEPGTVGPIGVSHLRYDDALLAWLSSRASAATGRYDDNLDDDNSDRWADDRSAEESDDGLLESDGFLETVDAVFQLVGGGD